MPNTHRRALFIFRRDLRLIDNTALNAARAAADEVLPCFIFDPQQIEPHRYQSRPALQFMLEALLELQQQLAATGGQLWLINREPLAAIAQLQTEYGIDAVFINRDYTPFSRRRDADIAAYCEQNGVACYSYNDALLTEPEQVFNQQHAPYQVFTAFYNRAKTLPVAWPQPLADGNWFCAGQTDLSLISRLQTEHRNRLAGGRTHAEARLAQVADCRDYALERDFPAQAATSELSVYLKFGCCSVREAYYNVLHALSPDHPLLRQLYWRDFFHHIAFHYPQVFGHAFLPQYDRLPWENDLAKFQAWAQGLTGFPIVDAAMRELNQTGWMHNRLRMIVASFLVKDLHISWRWGERYFAQHLLDYDPCVNNGNWQWAASTGCDAQPYFRIFNPWLQQKKFDPDCTYIKQWLPELRPFPAKTLHQWFLFPQPGSYPAPIVDHAERSAQIKQLFQALARV